MRLDDEAWMARAITLAERAASRGEVPVGALTVVDGRLVATGTNRMEASADATAHAEMVCLARTARKLGAWRLNRVTMYVTLEPCPMCASAMVLSRLGRLVYGASDPKKGADGSAYRLLDHPANNHRVRVTRGLLADECGAVLSRFFADQRRRKRTNG